MRPSSDRPTRFTGAPSVSSANMRVAPGQPPSLRRRLEMANPRPAAAGSVFSFRLSPSSRSSPTPTTPPPHPNPPGTYSSHTYHLTTKTRHAPTGPELYH